LSKILNHLYLTTTKDQNNNKDNKISKYLKLGEVEPGKQLLAFRRANGDGAAEVAGKNLKTRIY
jgi:hypothetical protein